MSSDPRPYRVAVGDSDLADLHARLAATRWPPRETVADWTQGIPLAVVRDLCDRWQHGYDWRGTEARLNRLAHLLVEIDGVDIHCVHVPSTRPGAVPLVLTHGWPGTFAEFEAVIGPLTDPPASAPAFSVVLASLPGYGFSGTPVSSGWGVERIADAWAELMTALGYATFGAAGSDWGTSVSTMLGLRHPDRVLGIHLIPPLAAPDADTALTAAERRALDDLAERARHHSAYGEIHRTRPQTIGYSLLDSPAGLCAWIAEKYWMWTDHDGDLYGVIDRDRVLDCVSIYWHTRTAASSARLYWESIDLVSTWIERGDGRRVDVPVGCSVFPVEVPRASRRWAARRFPDIRYWKEHVRGGHFAALEQPDLLVADLRAFFGSLVADLPPVADGPA